ncbi:MULTISPECIES: iron chelate uptake ABC transporter family permease subunit [unclassified Streptomyces]|uniref:FecCD family ABC transporter permease n=1 Tax=unclassified Streptomyces TaxID=2593676 RepID=UPI000DB92331|nr:MULTISPECIES: iron chelate uptake ABC transporter family permease subunit [unclassified Streptomyces]MYT75713.1 iron chelate uptake ABC transporter family permease subunit [Streptomyces sp. SID8367]RAJ87121.1 iron complex transport system permease protein [Streptomyces sp. PsTaAH-137]
MPTGTRLHPGGTQRLPATGRARPPLAAGLALGLALLAGAVALSLSVGTEHIPPGDVWSALFSPSGSKDDNIVRELRLPRTLIGVAVGAALGLAGGVMQTLTRNPLADPGLLGVNAGASAAVVTAIGVLGITSFTGYLWFALAGAAVAATAVNALGGARSATPVRLALAGTAVNAALFGYVNGLQQWDLSTLDSMRHWSVGTLAKRDPDLLVTVLPLLAAGALLTFALARPLGALALGEDHARALGTSIRRTRILSIVAITLLCGAATAVCGPIGFIGLMIPHAVRAFSGPDPRRMLPYCALFAPALLLVSDVVGRVVVSPSEIEVDIVTSFLGGLLFIHLVRQRKVAQL